jgi:hypothetical protein
MRNLLEYDLRCVYRGWLIILFMIPDTIQNKIKIMPEKTTKMSTMKSLTVKGFSV